MPVSCSVSFDLSVAPSISLIFATQGTGLDEVIVASLQMGDLVHREAEMQLVGCTPRLLSLRIRALASASWW